MQLGYRLATPHSAIPCHLTRALLTGAGLSPDTPALPAESVSTPVQKSVRSTMGSMADLIAQNTEDGPAPPGPKRLVSGGGGMHRMPEGRDGSG